MRLLTAICVLALALGANAQVGDSGIIDPSGRNIQFSHDFAKSNLLVGPSGIVSSTGQNIQLSQGQAQLHNGLPGPADFTPASSGTIIGASGYIKADGTPVQLTLEQVMSKVLAGPSGIVFREGGNVQFRKKRSTPLVGSAGYIAADGTPHQFTAEQAAGLVHAGPGGIVFKSGENIQHRYRRAFSDVSVDDVVGASGIVFADGRPGRQLTQEEADSVASAGPSGIVTTSGNYQFAGPRAKRSLNRQKRAFSDVSVGDVVGASGIVFADGRPGRQLTQEEADSVVLAGPSGVITTGRNYQYAGPRAKRSLNRQRRAFSDVSVGDVVGASGIVFADGRPGRQLTQEEADSVVLAGPSGVITTGRNYQYAGPRAKRSLNRQRRAFSDVKVGDVVGAAGIVFADGRPGRQLTQEEADSVASAGPSGIVTTSGNYQFSPALRARRSIDDLVGPSGAILDDGRTQVQFKKGNAKILLEGPSAYIFDDGTLVQKY